MELEIIVIVILAWTELILTYLCMKKARDYGYPNWLEGESKPIVKYFVEKFGLKGILISLIINPIAFTCVVIYIQSFCWPGTSFSYFFIGVLSFLVYSNYTFWRTPPELYNEKIFGKLKTNSQN